MESLTSNRCLAVTGCAEHSDQFNLNSTDLSRCGAWLGTNVITVTLTPLLPKSSESNRINEFAVWQFPSRPWDTGHSEHRRAGYTSPRRGHAGTRAKRHPAWLHPLLPFSQALQHHPASPRKGDGITRQCQVLPAWPLTGTPEGRRTPQRNTPFLPQRDGSLLSLLLLKALLHKTVMSVGKQAGWRLEQPSAMGRSTMGKIFCVFCSYGSHWPRVITECLKCG